MAIEKPEILIAYFQDNVTPIQIVTNVTHSYELRAFDDDFVFNEQRRILKIDLKGGMATVTATGRKLSVKEMSINFLAYLNGASFRFIESGTSLDEGKLGFKSPNYFNPGLLCDQLRFQDLAVLFGIEYNGNWNPGGTTTFDYLIQIDYYREVDYQKYLKDLQAEREALNRWG